MSTKDLQNNEKISILEFYENLCDLRPCDVYKKLNWTRQHYYVLKKTPFIPLKHMKALREALGLSLPDFYEPLEEFLSEIKTPTLGTKLVQGRKPD
jgi:hypothetical protein